MDTLILSVLKHGKFHDMKFKPHQRKKFLKEIEQQFIPILNEMREQNEDDENTIEEVLRELIKDWIEENGFSAE